MIATVNSSFLRRSGVLNALRKAESNFILLRTAPLASGGRWPARWRRRGHGISGVQRWLGTDSNRTGVQPSRTSCATGPARRTDKAPTALLVQSAGATSRGPVRPLLGFAQDPDGAPGSGDLLL